MWQEQKQIFTLCHVWHAQNQILRTLIKIACHHDTHTSNLQCKWLLFKVKQLHCFFFLWWQQGENVSLPSSEGIQLSSPLCFLSQHCNTPGRFAVTVTNDTCGSTMTAPPLHVPLSSLQGAECLKENCREKKKSNLWLPKINF